MYSIKHNPFQLFLNKHYARFVVSHCWTYGIKISFEMRHVIQILSKQKAKPQYIKYTTCNKICFDKCKKPTYYVKLYDDNNLSVDVEQALTYYLCHLYSRCEHSVSYPAPTYNAHLAAFRARKYTLFS